MNRSELNEKAKKYLANAGFGTGTNITLHGAKCLMVDFHIDETKLKDIGVLADVTHRALLMKIEKLEADKKLLSFMVENGLGEDDMLNDVTLPQEL